jgi:hypothetical protein
MYTIHVYYPSGGHLGHLRVSEVRPKVLGSHTRSF